MLVGHQTQGKRRSEAKGEALKKGQTTDSLLKAKGEAGGALAEVVLLS